MKKIQGTLLATALLAVSATAMAGNQGYTVDVIIADKIEGRHLDPQEINLSADPEVIKNYFINNRIWIEEVVSTEINKITPGVNIIDKRYTYELDEAQYQRGGVYSFEIDSEGNIDVSLEYNGVNTLEEGENNLYLDMETYTQEVTVANDVDSMVLEMDIRDILLSNVVMDVKDENNKSIGNNVIDRTHYLLINRK